jgi:hypothetical protein
MPTVSRQTPLGAKPSNSASVLSRIKPVSAGVGGIKILTYGRGKTGKTRLACTFPKPLLLIGTEDGTKSVSNIKGVDFVRLYESSEIDDLHNLLLQGKYKSACLDTAGGLQDMIVKEVLGLEDIPVQKSWGMAQQRDWGVIGMQTKERLTKIIGLADKTGINIIVIAHERNFGEEGTSDVMMPSVGAALTPTAAAWLNGATDYICQCFIRSEEAEQKVTIAGKTSTTKRKTGKCEYCLRTGPHQIYSTGFRLPEGVVLPDVIVNPDYSKILALIQGKVV